MRLDELQDGTCENCAEPYEQKRYDQRFCCRPCKRTFEDRERNAARSDSLRIARSGYVCPECGKTFDAKYLATQIYCSKRCKTREMLRRYRVRLGEDEYRKRRREASRRYKEKKAASSAVCVRPPSR
jgi:endogenous inhibitor of DNA gyrase (YacG/DUF329 family)